MRIAILALQGAFLEHEQMLQRLGTETFLIRNLEDWNQEKDGLVIPGGESTAILRIMKDEGLLNVICEAVSEGLPVLGTCAGMIVLARRVEDEEHTRLSTMDITVRRNAYGRQLGSFYTEQNFKGIGVVPMTFIRAPYITEVGENVEVLAVVDGHIVAARQDCQLVLSFHPELNENLRIHQYFLSMCEETIR
ncbi:MAG: pyridoxal 5'-phosphate synthase glutaminase subunit PdxT [Bacteroidales bacterium]|nr:pyridoxal 5'-phosphate synthase glutaminase subunit PdxT [Bacteroidales bacterium]